MQNSAVRVGRTHRLLGQNCHDFACVGEPEPGFSYGLVLDGCGSKYRASRLTEASHNEVGAKLLGRFASCWLQHRIGSGFEEALSLAQLLEALYLGSITFLRELLSSIPFAVESETVLFSATHLLSTMVGYVMTPESGAFFWSGDGYLCLNGQVTKLESDNQPHYLAYNLFTEKAASTSCECGFQTTPIRVGAETRWLAVASDGWNPDLLRQLAIPRPGLELQRWLNAQSRVRGQFEDDASVACWHGQPIDQEITA